MTPPVSIALCTYNGEAYLATQHDSILAQHSLPEEIKLSDDGTTGRRTARSACSSSSVTEPLPRGSRRRSSGRMPPLG